MTTPGPEADAQTSDPQTSDTQSSEGSGMTEQPTGVALQTGSSTATDAGSRGFRKVREGLVVSDKMDKTVVVAVEDRVQHALYKKTLRRTNKLKAHDEQNACGVGDRVLLMETRPLSATKRWRVVEILEKAK
jgi:small subunit ribosomal protein S17